MIIRSLIKKLFRSFDYDIVRYKDSSSNNLQLPPDFDEEIASIFKSVRPYTMTSPERVFELVNAVRYISKNRIEGDLVECGVWKGGSSMAMALTLMSNGDASRNIYLYDTFSGMSQPTNVDVNLGGHAAKDKYDNVKISEESSDWCFSSLDEVMKNLFSSGYPQDKLHFIQGMVEKTIPATVPDKIAILRLDTDWYESTRHELIHLFQRVSKYGVIIIDDYGHWAGARKAVDEYIADNNLCVYLHRIDYTGRTIIKPF